MAELSKHEEKTSQYIATKLREMGFTVKEHVGGFGLVVDIDSGVPGPTLMLRADMDALPYVSEEDPSKLIAIHACGHDAHSAVLLASAQTIKDVIKKGKVRLVFQPGEESLSGALDMTKDGVLEGVDIACGFHIRPIQDMPYGTFCSVITHVACATIEVEIKGRQAHAARPHLGINPIEAAVQYITTVGLMKVNPNKSWSIKPTQIHSEKGATNSIPSFVKLAFDVRAQDNEVLNEILSKMKAASDGLEISFGTQNHFERTEFCPGPDYDKELMKTMDETIKEQFGEQALAAPCGGGGEDFHFYKHSKPELRTVYFGIGAGATPGLHDRHMTFDDSILPSGSDLVVAFVKKLLG